MQLHGLVEQPALNDMDGQIVGFDRARGRYTIRVDEPQMRLAALLPANVLLPVGSAVRIDGLTTANASRFNGRWATVTAVHRPAGRYVVDLGGGHQLRLRFEHAVAGGSKACAPLTSAPVAGG